MARRLFRRFAPKNTGKFRQGWMGRLFGPILDTPLLWQLNRKAVARGLACGVFWALIPLPVQTLGAVASAIKLRGNVPMAMLGTWVSNPLTWVPVFYAGYRVGLAVLGLPEDDGSLLTTIERAFGAGLLSGTGILWDYFAGNLGRVLPLMLGCGMLGTLAASAAYWSVKGGWRWNIVRRWARRGHHIRCPHCRHLVLGGHDAPRGGTGVRRACPDCGKTIPVYRRLGLGFAAISRRLRQRLPRSAT